MGEIRREIELWLLNENNDLAIQVERVKVVEDRFQRVTEVGGLDGAVPHTKGIKALAALVVLTAWAQTSRTPLQAGQPPRLEGEFAKTLANCLRKDVARSVTEVFEGKGRALNFIHRKVVGGNRSPVQQLCYEGRGKIVARVYLNGAEISQSEKLEEIIHFMERDWSIAFATKAIRAVAPCEALPSRQDSSRQRLSDDAWLDEPESDDSFEPQAALDTARGVDRDTVNNPQKIAPPAQLALGLGSPGEFATAENQSVASTLISNPPRSLLKVRFNKAKTFALSFCAISLLLISVGGFLTVRSDPWPREPVVLFIGTGDTGYGKQHEQGLIYSLRDSHLNRVISIHEYNEMIGDHFPGGYDPEDLSRIEAEVTDVFDNYDVIAVVGPCAGPVVQPLVELIHELQPGTPIIIEAPVSRTQLGEPAADDYGPLVKNRPVYRISSGLDERIPFLASVMAELLANKVSMTWIVDDTPYSSNICTRLSDLLTPELQGENRDRLKIIKAQRSEITAALQEAGDPDFIFYIGTGEHYLDLASKLDDESPSYVGGLMNGYVFSDAPPNVLARLVDFEDISAPDVQRRDLAWIDFCAHFDQAAPNTRDYAFSYDAGICLRDAWGHAIENRPWFATHNAALRLMREGLERSGGHEGVSGHIAFPTGGGQNDGLGKTFTIHTAMRSDDRLQWIPLSTRELIVELRSRSQHHP